MGESTVGLIAQFNYAEGDLCVRVNRLSRKAWVRHSFAAISKLGDGCFWALMAAALLVLHGRAALPQVVLMALTAASGLFIYRQLKERLVRERPYIRHGGILCGTAPLDRYSFPSGHTLHAVSFTTLLVAFDPVLPIVAVPFAVLVAASRVILGLHYPSDVVVGAAIGFGIASTALALFPVVS